MWDALHASMRHWYALIGAGSGGARALQRDGVLAALVPSARGRSVVNSVVYERPEALAAAYDEIAAAYDEIDAKWTVWVHDGDQATKALLAERGHVLDAAPTAMAVDLAQGRPQRPQLDDWTDKGSLADVGAINDRAYAEGGDWFSRSLTALPAGELHVYVANVDGQPAGCCLTADSGANTELQMVAVLPEARGQGLSGRLIAHALADAVERGCKTSTLVATKLGRPVYERLGYRALGVLEMWELRPDER